MKRLAMLLSGLLMAPALAHADFKQGSQTLSVEIGAGGSSKEFAWSDVQAGARDEQVSDTGGSLGLQYVYYLKGSPAIGLGLDLIGNGLEDHDASNVFPNYDSTSHFRPGTTLAIMRLAYPKGVFRPYILGGLGFHTTRFLLQLRPNGSSTWSDTGTNETRDIVDDKATGFAAAFGFGADAFITEAFFIGMELRGTYLGKTNYGVTPAGRALGFNEVDDDLSVGNILFRTGFKFGA
jgi:opacity protein-like surface antigen